MKIDDKFAELERAVRPTAPRPIGHEQPQQQPRPDGTASPAPRADRVQISDAGRALAAGSTDGPAGDALSPERLAELRRRVLEGAYNSIEMVDQVARRILERGDV